jgi:hypothetical protein
MDAFHENFPGRAVSTVTIDAERDDMPAHTVVELSMTRAHADSIWKHTILIVRHILVQEKTATKCFRDPGTIRATLDLSVWSLQLTATSGNH